MRLLVGKSEDHVDEGDVAPRAVVVDDDTMMMMMLTMDEML